jgi:TRAP-type C4-dicarboxylate transport system permease small subunit
MEHNLRLAGKALSRACLSVASVALLIVIALTFVNVVMRYVFARPLAWAEELMMFLMIFSVYTGAISVAWDQRHIRLEGIRNMAPPSLRRPIDILGALALVAILAPVIYSSTTVVALLGEMGEASDAMHLPIWIPQAIIPIALAFIALIAIVRIVLPDEDRERRDLLEGE